MDVSETFAVCLRFEVVLIKTVGDSGGGKMGGLRDSVVGTQEAGRWDQ